jgi:hypothetical protein
VAVIHKCIEKLTGQIYTAEIRRLQAANDGAAAQLAALYSVFGYPVAAAVLYRQALNSGNLPFWPRVPELIELRAQVVYETGYEFVAGSLSGIDNVRVTPEAVDAVTTAFALLLAHSQTNEQLFFARAWIRSISIRMAETIKREGSRKFMRTFRAIALHQSDRLWKLPVNQDDPFLSKVRDMTQTAEREAKFTIDWRQAKVELTGSNSLHFMASLLFRFRMDTGEIQGAQPLIKEFDADRPQFWQSQIMFFESLFHNFVSMREKAAIVFLNSRTSDETKGIALKYFEENEYVLPAKFPLRCRMNYSDFLKEHELLDEVSILLELTVPSFLV